MGLKNREALIKSFKEDKVKNANVIVDFLQLLESNQKNDVQRGIQGLQVLFTHLLENCDIKTPSALPEDLQIASQKFNNWLYDRYNETHEKLLTHLRHADKAVSDLALSTIIVLMKTEGRHPIVKKSPGNPVFPAKRLKVLLAELLSDEVDHQKSITGLQDHMKCQDFMFYTLVSAKNIVKQKSNPITEIYMNNLLLLLEAINIPDATEDMILCLEPFIDRSKKTKVLHNASEAQVLKISYAKARTALNVIWKNVMMYPLTSNLYRRCLILIPEKVMHHLEKPLQLTGFFMDAYDLGGALSLLSLQGVFILVNKYNLDYPNFYQKLYCLLEPTAFHAKYRPRFFMLMDKFLSSSHIPEYIVAAFIKRLSRLSLVAPASCLVLILKFIANLLIRHPGLQRLIHNPEAEDVENDPYDFEETDLSKCGACDSSLWEIATLQQHVIPSVTKATGFLEKSLPTIEHDISELVETTYEEVHEKSLKLNLHETVSTTFHKPSGLFAHRDDKMSDVWSTV